MITGKATVRELLSYVNAMLQENMNRPANARKAIDTFDLSIWMSHNTHGFHFGNERFDIMLRETPLVIKTRRKKSGVYGRGYRSEAMTISEVYVEDSAYLDMTLAQLRIGQQKEEKAQQQLVQQQKAKALSDFQSILAAHNMTPKMFRDLEYLKEKIEYQDLRKIGYYN